MKNIDKMKLVLIDQISNMTTEQFKDWTIYCVKNTTLILSILIKLQYLLVKIAGGYMENVLNLNEQKNVMSDLWSIWKAKCNLNETKFTCGMENTFMKNEIYSVAYNDKYDNGFSKMEPWIISDFGNDSKKCKIKANELIRQWCKNVTIFKCNELPEIVTWDYVKAHQI